MEWACEDLNLGPLPYQLTARNRCAGARFRRSRPTVGAEVKCSIGVQLCVLPMRLEIHWRRADHRPFPLPQCFHQHSSPAFLTPAGESRRTGPASALPLAALPTSARWEADRFERE